MAPGKSTPVSRKGSQAMFFQDRRKWLRQRDGVQLVACEPLHDAREARRTTAVRMRECMRNVIAVLRAPRATRARVRFRCS